MNSPLRRLWESCSLSARLIIVMFTTLVLSAALLVSHQVHGELDRNRESLVTRSEREARFLVPAVAEQAIIGDYSVIEQMLQVQVQSRDIRLLEWVDRGGRVVSAFSVPTELTAPDWFVRWASFRVDPRTEEIRVGGESYGAVRVFMAVEPTINHVWTRFVADVQIVLVGIGALLGLALLVVQDGLAPLHGLAGAARRFGKGEVSVRIRADGPPEIASTGKAFNNMAESISALVSSLRQSEATNRLLATAVRQSHEAIITKDLDGVIMSWNEAAARMFGYSPEEAIGQTVRIIHTVDDPGEFERVVERMRTGRAQRFEAKRRSKDGRVIYIDSTVSPLHDEHGAHIGEISVIRDVTQQKLAEEALARERERAQVTLASIADGVITTDTAGRVDYLNPVAERMTGWRLAEALGRPLNEVFRVLHESTCEPAECLVEELLARGRVVSQRTDVVLSSRTGQVFPVEDTAASIRSRDGSLAGVVVVFSDVSESRTMAQQLQWQASHDALTGLTNRREFERRLGEMVQDAREHHQHHSLLYLDLDQFKVVNDTCGHVAGDEMLRQVTGLLRHAVRDSDTLARLGGDEFGVLLNRCPLDHADRVADALLKRLADFRFLWQGQTFVTGMSIGIAPISGDGETGADILGKADAACYSAKEKGRNRIQIYRPGDTELAQRHGEMQWVSRIARAFEENRFRLHCQMIAPTEARPGMVPHYEVLVRMVGENGDMVPPMAFIPPAERYGLMPQLDRKVVALAFEAHSSMFGHLHSSARPHFSINLSGGSVSDENFLGFLREQFGRWRVPPECIAFEITETAAVANLASAGRLISELKSFGCRFSLDDFGSGLSSFAYLKNLPVDYLKIDGSFVKDMASDPIDSAMVQAINHVGHVMGIKTIAEFVEDDLTLGMLKLVGVDFVQGYGVERPMPIENLPAALRNFESRTAIPAPVQAPMPTANPSGMPGQVVPILRNA